MITLKNIKVKGNLIYCDMYQDGNSDPIELVFEVIDINTINLIEIHRSFPEQKVYLENYAESMILNYLKTDSLENLRSFGKRCWC